MGAPKTSRSNVDTESKRAASLARKRARDRRAQQAMRDRAKGEVETLRKQFTELMHHLTEREGSFSRDLLRCMDENDELRRQLAELRQKKARSDLLPDPAGMIRWKRTNSFCVDFSVLAALASPDLVSSPFSPPLETATALAPSPWDSHSQSPTLPLGQGREADRLQLPLHVPPTCPSDRIMQPFIHETQLLVREIPTGATSASASASTASWKSTSPASLAVIQTAITRVAGDVLLTYPQIDTLPKKLACLYVISTVLNWLIYGTHESFERMPRWLRPTKTQLEVPHPAWIDRIQWPYVRNYLINNYRQVTFDDYSDAFSLAFSVNWPYPDNTLVLEDTGPGLASKRYFLNPVFEAHIRDLNNWIVGPRYWQVYADLRGAYDSSRRDFGNRATSPSSSGPFSFSVP
ncbi:hypothetical protein A1O3_04620 [Capronia epimyces CBS 606.96]|uniref:BZIP domain-containing protein n=1 Tax=Capronia epimyces CBS 606.96 TaxID=1182542 RepID=W9XUQ9_9EURO|nr:uncharacterized protein A1O3_04620 [Capronia epimyces CBS 606.96]EXJ83953.1 hypothetical protein A1O3_04620 [Capronia epimyces CBS 606.96]